MVAELNTSYMTRTSGSWKLLRRRSRSIKRIKPQFVNMYLPIYLDLRSPLKPIQRKSCPQYDRAATAQQNMLRISHRNHHLNKHHQRRGVPKVPTRRLHPIELADRAIQEQNQVTRHQVASQLVLSPVV
jgi:hypothetical protein